MTTDAELIDRRKHKRYAVKEGAFTTNCTKSGMITDISSGGLTFRYIDRKTCRGETTLLDIVFDADDFYLDRIPCKTVSDFITITDLPDKAKVIKRHSVEFGCLTAMQIEQLQFFIANYTMGELPSGYKLY